MIHYFFYLRSPRDPNPLLSSEPGASFTCKPLWRKYARREIFKLIKRLSFEERDNIISQLFYFQFTNPILSHEWLLQGTGTVLLRVSTLLASHAPGFLSPPPRNDTKTIQYWRKIQAAKEISSQRTLTFGSSSLNFEASFNSLPLELIAFRRVGVANALCVSERERERERAPCKILGVTASSLEISLHGGACEKDVGYYMIPLRNFLNFLSPTLSGSIRKNGSPKFTYFMKFHSSLINVGGFLPRKITKYVLSKKNMSSSLSHFVL